jgi:protein-arginine kinase
MWVNEGDHLRIISMEKGGDVKKVFERLGRAVRTIESILKEVTGKETVFMSDPTLGMITCCPSNLGTGMRASFHILVPKLIKKLGLNGIDKFAHEMNCQARGSSGEHSDSIDRIDISNWRRLGFKECDLIQDMINCANKLAEM